jgi:hypothetical protein
MAALFCLRLALGMLACLPLLPARLVHPRYYRTHLLTVLGLALAAAAFLYSSASALQLGSLAVVIVLCWLGTILWGIEGAPGGRIAIWLAIVGLATTLWLLAAEQGDSHLVLASRLYLGDLASAALLGTVMSAMLMGHFYLISPTMELRPLLLLLACFGVALLVRILGDGFALWLWTRDRPLQRLSNDQALWLTVRWLIGLALPLVLGVLAWRCARIRATQSATGILYVAVVFCFLGELTALLLRTADGAVL